MTYSSLPFDTICSTVDKLYTFSQLELILASTETNVLPMKFLQLF